MPEEALRQVLHSLSWPAADAQVDAGAERRCLAGLTPAALVCRQWHLVASAMLASRIVVVDEAAVTWLECARAEGVVDLARARILTLGSGVLGSMPRVHALAASMSGVTTLRAESGELLTGFPAHRWRMQTIVVRSIGGRTADWTSAAGAAEETGERALGLTIADSAFIEVTLQQGFVELSTWPATLTARIRRVELGQAGSPAVFGTEGLFTLPAGSLRHLKLDLMTGDALTSFVGPGWGSVPEIETVDIRVPFSGAVDAMTACLPASLRALRLVHAGRVCPWLTDGDYGKFVLHRHALDRLFASLCGSLSCAPLPLRTIIDLHECSLDAPGEVEHAAATLKSAVSAAGSRARIRLLY